MKKIQKTSSAKKGGLFVGKSHAKGGIPAIVVDTGQPIEVEGGEVIINKEASKKYWKELSEINQSAGNGVPIPPPMEFSSEVSKFKGGGKISMYDLKKGTEMELEHADTIDKYKKQGISTKTVARSIAQDHLKENPNYYKILSKLKLAKGGEIVCRSCGESWEKTNKDGSLFECQKCGSNNARFYKKGGKTDPCWDGYEMIGMKTKSGRKVPNCVQTEQSKSKIFKTGGSTLTITEKSDIYERWKSLVNMSKAELQKFYNSTEGKEAGLSQSEANSLGIDNGRTSARWILKMKEVPYLQWSPQMWRWAKKQISFISRMKGNKGSLYESNGSKTRKHTSLLIWGHNPEKYNTGGGVAEKFYRVAIHTQIRKNAPKTTKRYVYFTTLEQCEKYIVEISSSLTDRQYVVIEKYNVTSNEWVDRFSNGGEVYIDETIASKNDLMSNPKVGMAIINTLEANDMFPNVRYVLEVHKENGQVTGVNYGIPNGFSFYMPISQFKNQFVPSSKKGFKTGGKTDAEQDKIALVMHEFKQGKLYSSSGQKVTDREQAIAIALSEAGVSKYAKGSKIPSKNKGGDCYYVAGTIAMNENLPPYLREAKIKMPEFVGTPYVVHAEVEGQGAISGLRYGHAWVEDDLNVYDYSNGREIVFPKQLYYMLGRVITEKPKYFKYTFKEATRKMIDTGHYGCWDLITESGL